MLDLLSFNIRFKSRHKMFWVLIFYTPVSNHWLLWLFASQIRRSEDLSVITAKQSPSLSHPKQQHIPGNRIWSTISAWRLYIATSYDRIVLNNFIKTKITLNNNAISNYNRLITHLVISCCCQKSTTCTLPRKKYPTLTMWISQGEETLAWSHTKMLKSL